MGKRKITQLKKNYGKNAQFFLVMFSGTGDVYFAAMYLNGFCELNHYENACLLVIGEHLKQVSYLFEGVKAECITKAECIAIEKYRVLYQDKSIHLVHYDTPIFRNHIMINGRLRGCRNINFLDIYLTATYGDISNLHAQQPHFSEESAEKKIKENGISKDHSVILSPYANSMPHIPGLFWKILADKLIHKGYDVYTNCAPKETEIYNTKRLEMSFAEAGYIVEYAGYYIGLRSGFTDIISSTCAKKVIFYPQHLKKGAGDSLTCYSLIRLGIDLGAIEYVYNEEKLADEIYIRNLAFTTLENFN